MVRDLEATLQEFNAWRASKGSAMGRVPDRLWSLAIELSKTHGVVPTAKLLRLNHATLRAKADRKKFPPTSSPSGGEAMKLIKVAPVSIGTGHDVQPRHDGRQTLIAEIVVPSRLAVRLFSGIDAEAVKCLAHLVQGVL